MKKIITLFLLIALTGSLSAQEAPEKVMEKRAREMHRIITINDRGQWEKFISENYTQALIDRPAKSTVRTQENGTVVISTSPEAKGSTNVEKKAEMFSRLNSDFGASKISSLKVEGETVIMSLKNSDMTGVITLRFSNTSPYLIDRLGVEVEN